MLLGGTESIQSPTNIISLSFCVCTTSCTGDLFGRLGTDTPSIRRGPGINESSRCFRQRPRLLAAVPRPCTCYLIKRFATANTHAGSTEFPKKHCAARRQLAYVIAVVKARQRNATKRTTSLPKTRQGYNIDSQGLRDSYCRS